MGKRKAASFVEAIDAPDAKTKAAEKIVTLQAGNIAEGTPDAAPKKKKRTYANAYVRKGQGLEAAIQQVRDEKNRLLDETAAKLNIPKDEAMVLLNAGNGSVPADIRATSANLGALPGVQPPAVANLKASSSDSASTLLQSSQTASQDVMHSEQPAGGAKEADRLLASVPGQGEQHLAAGQSADAVQVGLAEAVKLRKRSTKSGKPPGPAENAAPGLPYANTAGEPESAVETLKGLTQVPVKMEPDAAGLTGLHPSEGAEAAAGAVPDFGLTKAGKPRKRRAPKPKAESVTAATVVKEEAQPSLPAVPAATQEIKAEDVPDFGLTKAGKPRKRRAPKPKAAAAEENVPPPSAVVSGVELDPASKGLADREEHASAAEVTAQASTQPISKAEPISELQTGEALVKGEDDVATTAIDMPSKPAGKVSKPRKPRAKKAKATAAVKEEPAAMGSIESSAEGAMPEIVPASTENGEAEDAKKAPRRRRKEAEKVNLVGDQPETQADGTAAEAEPKKKRRRGPDPNAFKLPGPEVLEEAKKLKIEPRPVPNTGFACLNATLRAQKPPMFTNRGCIKKTFEEKGLDHISELVLENCKSISGLVHWNHLNGIRFFRMSSCIFPWNTEWDVEQLKDYEAIKEALMFAGDLARAYDQRLTFHPTHFVKLGCEDSPLLDRSIKELEQHSVILDLMGYEPSHWNKINIHIGGQYGDKVATIERFAKNFWRLSPNCQKRLTVENDDRGNSYSLNELMVLHEKTGIPLVFDFHHHKFCTGDLTEEEAFKKALTTWPKGIRPVVHWSESQEGRRPSAHSDFVKGPLRLYGLDDQVDVMIESKAKELALLRLRDPTFTPEAAALALIYGPGGDD